MKRFGKFRPANYKPTKPLRKRFGRFKRVEGERGVGRKSEKWR